MQEINLGTLENGPHADLIREMARKCATDPRIQAIWVGGSLASGIGDAYSDIDFRIAVQLGEVGDWVAPDWEQYLPIQPCGGTLMRFGEQALLHHLVLADGTIVDFFVQDTERQNFEPNIVVLACRDVEFQSKLEGFARPSAALVKEIDGEAVRRFLVDYWIITHKELKALARQYDLSPFVGLYWERLSLLRAWYMEITGKDIQGRATIHMLGALHKGLAHKLTDEQQVIVGMPSRTPEETVAAIEAIRGEMSRIGRSLAQKHNFTYPSELEAVVQQVWELHKVQVISR